MGLPIVPSPIKPIRFMSLTSDFILAWELMPVNDFVGTLVGYNSLFVLLHLDKQISMLGKGEK
ncbi:hypothetical protein D3C84_1032240 [compost metagenome]